MDICLKCACAHIASPSPSSPCYSNANISSTIFPFVKREKLLRFTISRWAGRLLSSAFDALLLSEIETTNYKVLTITIQEQNANNWVQVGEMKAEVAEEYLCVQCVRWWVVNGKAICGTNKMSLWCFPDLVWPILKSNFVSTLAIVYYSAVIAHCFTILIRLIQCRKFDKVDVFERCTPIRTLFFVNKTWTQWGGKCVRRHRIHNAGIRRHIHTHIHKKGVNDTQKRL